MAKAFGFMAWSTSLLAKEEFYSSMDLSGLLFPGYKVTKMCESTLKQKPKQMAETSKQ